MRELRAYQFDREGVTQFGDLMSFRILQKRHSKHNLFFFNCHKLEPLLQKFLNPFPQPKPTQLQGQRRCLLWWTLPWKSRVSFHPQSYALSSLTLFLLVSQLLSIRLQILWHDWDLISKRGSKRMKGTIPSLRFFFLGTPYTPTI